MLSEQVSLCIMADIREGGNAEDGRSKDPSSMAGSLEDCISAEGQAPEGDCGLRQTEGKQEETVFCLSIGCSFNQCHQGGSLTWALPAESLKGTNGKETVADSGKLVISNNRRSVSC